jgi:CMP-2-keto-3-deoxyoctulosonic acid synthetase
VGEAAGDSIGVDTASDLEAAERAWKKEVIS